MFASLILTCFTAGVAFAGIIIGITVLTGITGIACVVLHRRITKGHWLVK
jgi:hypothetical protein